MRNLKPYAGSVLCMVASAATLATVLASSSEALDTKEFALGAGGCVLMALAVAAALLENDHGSFER